MPPRVFSSFSCKGFYPLGGQLHRLCPSCSQKRTLLFSEYLDEQLLLTSSLIIAFQPFGDFLRPNAHWHSLVLEGGFAPDGRFLFLPIHDTKKLTEAFRCAVIKLLLSKGLISEDFAGTPLCWKNSGFSVNNQVRINGDDHKTRIALAQCIARAPLSMEKLTCLPFQGKVSYTSDFNPAIGDTTKVWDARDFIAAATLFIRRAGAPPAWILPY